MVCYNRGETHGCDKSTLEEITMSHFLQQFTVWYELPGNRNRLLHPLFVLTVAGGAWFTFRFLLGATPHWYDWVFAFIAGPSAVLSTSIQLWRHQRVEPTKTVDTEQLQAVDPEQPDVRLTANEFLHCGRTKAADDRRIAQGAAALGSTTGRRHRPTGF